ncbi:MAG: hypothetical protein IJ733_19850 [Lachnospiraceae bacterium]|nr:hypothetical protein [Lachnospiraceae bacterium]
MEDERAEFTPKQALELWRILKRIKNTVISDERTHEKWIRLIWSMVSKEPVEIESIKRNGIVQYDSVGFIDLFSVDDYVFEHAGIENVAYIYAAGIVGQVWSDSPYSDCFEELLGFVENPFHDDEESTYAFYEDEEAFRLFPHVVEDIRAAYDSGWKEFSEGLENLYSLVCFILPIYIGRKDLFARNLPGLLMVMGDNQVGFIAKGSDEVVECGCLGAETFVMESAAWILPLLVEGQDKPEELEALTWCLDRMREGKYMFQDDPYLGALFMAIAEGEDLYLYRPCCEGSMTASKRNILPDPITLFAPKIWEALYPAALEKYHVTGGGCEAA